MSEVFGLIYADAYDLLYHDKDYHVECDLIEHIFHTYEKASTSSIIDLGCGTGNHAIALARRGYQVVGVDFSKPMITRARKKAAGISHNGDITFHLEDIRKVNLKRDFDAALMMFAVLGYQLENNDVLSALRTARRHLRTGGLLLFDVWYGPAVLHQRPSDRVKVIPTPQGQIMRAASGELGVERHTCTVHYRVWQLEKGRLMADNEEHHTMRYFFPLELDLFMENAGFSMLRLGAFPEFDREPDENTWNVLGVARAI